MSADELQQLGCESWRHVMPDVRKLVYEWRDEGLCEVLQKGAVVDGDEGDVSGPIRVRRVDNGEGDEEQLQR